MRVGDDTLYRRFLSGFTRNRSAVADALASLADQKRVRVASDDPVAAQGSMALRARLVRLEGFTRAAGAARYDVATLDRVLGEAGGLLLDARNEAMAGASDVMSDGRGVRATKVRSLRDQLLQLANTYQGDRYLFSGTQTLTAAFDAAGNYQGSAQEVEAPLDSNETIAATVAGDRVFTPATGPSVFQLLETLATDLENGNTAGVAAALDPLKQVLNRFNEVRADVGLRLERIDTVLSSHDDETTAALQRVSELEGADIAEVAATLSQAQTGLDALSATASRTLGRSLFDYLG